MKVSNRIFGSARSVTTLSVVAVMTISLLGAGLSSATAATTPANPAFAEVHRVAAAAAPAAPRLIKVPSVAGLPSRTAARRLEAVGLKAVRIGVASSKVKTNLVVSNLMVGKRALPGTTVIVYVSIGTGIQPLSGWKTAKVSWYGPGFYGRTMAGGGKLTTSSMVVAHRSMKFGTRIQFTYKGRTCIAVVRDRGPYVSGRTFDLGPGTAKALGFGGVGHVAYRIVK